MQCHHVPAYTSTIAMATILDCRFKFVPHPPYSPDLIPSDFHLFPNIKKALTSQRFSNDNEGIDAVKEFLGTQEKEFSSIEMKALWHGQGVSPNVCFT